MSILIDQDTHVLIQGITGNEGSTACREMLGYGTKVVAGVTPGKGGQEVHGVPVYDSVAEAVRMHPELNASLISVPAGAVRDAVREALAHNIPLIDILTEHVTTRDAAEMIAWAKKSGATLIGPSSVGIINPGVAKIGSIGSGSTRNVFSPGTIGVVSKSGGMTAEISVTLTRAGFGQSTALGIGGDQLIGFDFVDALRLFAMDEETEAVILFGEVGGTYEELVAEYILSSHYPKPVIAVVAGKFTNLLPQGTVLGHAGAIVAKGRGDYTSKITAFEKAGVKIARTLDEIPLLLRQVLPQI